ASDRIRRVGIMDDRAFFSDRSGNLYAVDLKNGKAIWKAAKRNKVVTPLAAYNKLVYYGGEEKRSEERRVGKEGRERMRGDGAEDGIRDWSVTGVQTCALPI